MGCAPPIFRSVCVVCGAPTLAFPRRALKVPLALPLGPGEVPLGAREGPRQARDAPSGTSEAPSGSWASTEWDPRVGPCHDRFAPVAADSTLKWRPLRWRPTSRAGAAGREPDERTDLQFKRVKAAHTPPTRPSEVVPGETSPQKWQVVGNGRVIEVTCLPRGRPALVPAACCLLSPLPSFAGAGFTRADDAAG